MFKMLKNFFSKEKKQKKVSVVSVRNGNHIRPSDEVIKEHFNEMKKNISYYHIRPF